MQSIITNSTLQIGSQGEAVKELQQLLNKTVNRDHQLIVDGIFGPKTEKTVKLCQYLYFLQEDGIVGPKTWKSLYAGAPTDMPILSFGSQGNLVKEVQKTLNQALSNRLVVDGMFGLKTEAAIRDFQQGRDMEVDRTGKVIVGPKTWQALSGTRKFFAFD